MLHLNDDSSSQANYMRGLHDDLRLRIFSLLRAKDIALLAQASSCFSESSFLTTLIQNVCSELYPDFCNRGKSEQKLPPVIRLRLFELKRVAGILAAPECIGGCDSYWISKVSLINCLSYPRHSDSLLHSPNIISFLDQQDLVQPVSALL